MRVKLIAVDLDGTLLKSDKTIDQETCEKLIDFQNNDGILVIATGRRLWEIKKYINELHMLDFNNGYVIHCDGQYIYDINKDKIIKKDLLTEIDLKYILDFYPISEYKIVYYDEEYDYVLSSKSKIYVSMLNFYYKVVKRNDRLKIFKYSPKKRLPSNEGIEKVVIKSKRQNLAGINIEQTISILYDKYNITKTNIGNYEVAKYGINKFSSLKEVMNYHNICDEEVVVFGDDGNDIEVLKNFKYSYAMGNAPNHIKKIASFITDTNDDKGVLKGILNHLGGQI